MIVTKLDVTFDPAAAMDFYRQVEAVCQDIKWKIPDDYFYETLRSIYGWSLTVPVDVDPNQPFGLYQSIDITGRENYQETKAAFGFGKSLIDLFPMAYRFSLGVLPPGVYAAPHTDGTPERDALRGWIPIVTDPSIKWITKDGVADLRAGNVYIIDIAEEHEFINEGSITGIGMVFDVLRTDVEAAKLVKGRIS